MANKCRHIMTGLLAASLLFASCACSNQKGVPNLTATSVPSTEILIQTSSATPAIPASDSTSVADTTGRVDDRYIEENGTRITYEEILQKAGYTEVFAAKTPMDLDGFKDVLTKYAYRETTLASSDLPAATTCMTSEDGLDTIYLSYYSDANAAHNAVYKYIVTTIHAFELSEQSYQLVLQAERQESYLFAYHFDMQESGNQLVLFYQSGTAVIRAQLPCDGKRIDTFVRAIEDLGFTRTGVSYDQEEIPFPDKATSCTAKQFSGVLADHGYSVEQQVTDERSVYGGSKDNSINWSYEQMQTVEFCQTQFNMNFAFRLMDATQTSITYHSGRNYEMWIEDAPGIEYDINIRIDDMSITLRSSADDSATKKQVRDIIMDACF